MMRVRTRYAPAIVFKNERTNYLSEMRKADEGDVSPLGAHGTGLLRKQAQAGEQSTDPITSAASKSCMLLGRAAMLLGRKW